MTKKSRYPRGMTIMVAAVLSLSLTGCVPGGDNGSVKNNESLDMQRSELVDAARSEESTQSVQSQSDSESQSQAAPEKLTEPEKPEYKVVAELGSLDRIPISLNGEAWLIQKDGLYSYINSEGGQISDSKEPHAEIRYFAYNINPPIQACIAELEQIPVASSGNQYPYNQNPGDCYCRAMGGAPLPFVMYKDGDGVVTDKLTEGYELSEAESLNPDELPIVVHEKGTFEGPYWIYNPKMDKLTGPYEDDVNQGVVQTMSPFDRTLVVHAGYLNSLNNAPVSNPYWSKDGSSYTLYSKDGSKEKTGFDRVELIDTTSIAGWKGNTVTVFDENLNEVLSGEFEQAGNRVGKNIPVKIDGTWKLIELS